MANGKATDLVLLDCLTCRHKFTIRRSVACMVAICPACRHFVVPCEREVRSVSLPVVGPPPDDDEPFELLDPPPIVVKPVVASMVAVRPGPPPLPVQPAPSMVVAVHPSPVPAPSMPPMANPDPAAVAVVVVVRFFVGMVLGAGTVFGLILALPLLLLLVAVLVAFALLVVAFGALTASPPPPAGTDWRP